MEPVPSANGQNLAQQIAAMLSSEARIDYFRFLVAGAVLALTLALSKTIATVTACAFLVIETFSLLHIAGKTGNIEHLFGQLQPFQRVISRFINRRHSGDQLDGGEILRNHQHIFFWQFALCGIREHGNVQTLAGFEQAHLTRQISGVQSRQPRIGAIGDPLPVFAMTTSAGYIDLDGQLLIEGLDIGAAPAKPSEQINANSAPKQTCLFMV